MILGVDPSMRSAGIALLSGDSYTTDIFNFRERVSSDNLRNKTAEQISISLEVAKALEATLSGILPEEVLIAGVESPIFSSRVPGTEQVSRVHAAVLATFHVLRVPIVVHVAPIQLRSFYKLPRKGGKLEKTPAALELLLRRLGLYSDMATYRSSYKKGSSDRIDALGLALIALYWYFSERNKELSLVAHLDPNQLNLLGRLFHTEI